MATDSGLSGLQARLDAIQGLLDGDMTPMAHAVGKGARTNVNAVARDVGGGDAVLSHMGRRGARLGMRYDVEQRGRLTFIKLAPAGPWMLTQKGAKPHTIKPKAARSRGVGSGWGIDAAVYAPGYDHPTRKPFTHPGAPGRNSVQRALTRVRRDASKDFHAAYLEQLAKVMS